MRLLVVALIAALGITAVAYAQSNTYTINAKVPSGGSKKKPKAGGFTFNFTVADPAGNIPQVIQTYSLGIAGTQVNTKVAPSCSATKAATDDSGCPKKALIGSGSITAIVGSAGQPVASKAADCILDLRIWNGGNNKATLFVQARPSAPAGNCAGANISQSIDAKWTKANGGTALVFSVPEVLRHPVAGIDAVVVDVKSTLKNVKGKIKGKKRGYFESIGCKGQRKVTATFTDEKGQAVPVDSTAGKC